MLFFFFLSLYLKNWWSHLHSLAWTDGVIRNKILNSILKRIISAPIPCKQLSSRQLGKAFKIQHPHTGLSKVKALPEHWQVDICSGFVWARAQAAATHPGGHLHWARLENTSWKKSQLLHLLKNLFLGNWEFFTCRWGCFWMQLTQWQEMLCGHCCVRKSVTEGDQGCPNCFKALRANEGSCALSCIPTGM